MLKLNKFHRLLWLSCRKVDKTHGRSLPRLNCEGKRCGAGCVVVDRVVIAHFHSSPSFHDKRANGKNRFTNSPANMSDSEDLNNMSDPERPTASYVSCGEDFTVSDNYTSGAWQQQEGSVFTVLGETFSNIPIQGPSNFRTWEPLTVSTASVEGTALKFRVISYNMLAQCLLESHPYLYTKCNPENLKWHKRASRLYEEIFSYDPDILCLQEVQASHVPTFYNKFDQIGYFGIFKQKTGRRDDGCAIYFKKSLFEMKDHLTVEFHQDLPILNWDNVGVMLKLAPKNGPLTSFVVATTHLLYNPQRTDVRLAQMQLFLAELDRFAYYNNGKHQYGHYPIILTGDFNSTPDSAVIELLDNGLVSANQFRDASDWRNIGVTDNCQHLAVFLNRLDGQTTDFADINIQNTDYCMPKSVSPVEIMSDMFNTGALGHTLRLTSVYDKFKPNGAFEVTAFQNYWVNVDYMYFSRCNTLILTERLRLPTTSECETLGFFPNENYGSDHLALAATFELRPSMIDSSCETQ